MREKAKAGLVSPSVPCVGRKAGAAYGAAPGTKTPPGRGEAVAEHPSGAAALALGSSFAAFSP